MRRTIEDISELPTDCELLQACRFLLANVVDDKRGLS